MTKKSKPFPTIAGVAEDLLEVIRMAEKFQKDIAKSNSRPSEKAMGMARIDRQIERLREAHKLLTEVIKI